LRTAYWGVPFQYYQYDKPLDAPYGVLSQSDIIKCSNGSVYKTSQWNIDKLMTFHQYLVIEGEDNYNIKEMSKQATSSGDSVTTVQRMVQFVDAQTKFYSKVWSKEFAEFTQASANVNFSVTYYIRDVLSNIGYDIYLVTAPVLASDSNAAPERRLPSLINCTLSCPGKKAETLINPNPETNKNTDFVTSTDSMKYILLAEDYKFDVCTRDISDENLQVTLKLETKVSNAQLRNKQYVRNFNVDCILLVPHGTFFIDEPPIEGVNVGIPTIWMFPHGLYYDRPFRGWYMLR
jgi:hypothetical protein